MIEVKSQDEGRVRSGGRYAVYDAIARGGMATVHFARLIGAVGFSRIVAIKRLHQAYAQSAEFVSMFLDEARLVARIKHPNVVPTLDVIAADGELSIVMEYVHGESLSRLLKTARARNQPVPLGVVAAIMSGVLHGLHAAHEATSERGEPLDIVHRDVSPQNVLVGGDGVPRLLDFGIAKAAGRVQDTRDGVLKGKIAYMAPEQLHGSNTTRATDVYAAGVLLWEMLSGERFYEADSDVSLIVKALSGRRDPPSNQSWGKCPARTREPRARIGRLDDIALRALAVDPADRYASAREMALELERAVPLATPSDVALWVDDLAADALAERAEVVRAIECDEQEETRVSLVVRTDGVPVPARSRGALVEDDGTQVTRIDDAPQSASSSLTPAPVTFPQIELEVAKFRPKRRAPLALAIGTVAAAVALLLAFGARTRDVAVVPPAVAVASPPGPSEAELAPPSTIAAAAPLTTVDDGIKPDAGLAAPTTTVATKPTHAAAPARTRRMRNDLDIRTER